MNAPHNIHSPPNDAPLDELWAWVSVDDTGEGLIANIVPGIGATVLVTGRRSIAEQLRLYALEVSKRTDKRVRLVRFARASIEWEGPP